MELDHSTSVSLGHVSFDVYDQVVLDGLKQAPAGSPIAQKTYFGWLLTSIVSSSAASTPQLSSYHFNVESNLDHSAWELHSFPAESKRPYTAAVCSVLSGYKSNCLRAHTEVAIEK